MTLERIEHKVFASEAPLDEMGQFGSALATTKLNTKDVAEIQALPAYTKGWGSAIISENNYPAMEEMNGVLNVMSYHTGYLYQEGIPVYSSTQTYSATSWVKTITGEKIYKSKQDENKGHDLEDTDWWEELKLGGGGSGLQMFDTILKDHVLTYEESKGLALQGTYVYKDAIAGSRYGYPDFYAKCLEEYENSSNVKQWVKSNITKVGSLIDNNGVISGFNSTSWAVLPNNFSPNSSNWEMVFKFTTGTIGTVQSLLNSSDLSYEPIDINIDKTGILMANIYANNTATKIASITGATVLNPNTDYYYSLEYNSTTGYTLKLGTNKDNLAIEGTSNVTTIINSGYNLVLGSNFTTNGAYYDGAFLGSLDLNESHININGERWWTGVDSLEYKKNSNGHLFYDISNKEYIDSIFQETGSAWLYGVDTENERIFLPRDKYFAIKGIAPVVGNGMSLGLTDGTNNLGIIRAGSGDYILCVGTQNYGKDVGTTGTAPALGGVNIVTGVTTDPTKSGMEAHLQAKEDKYLYICVGNTESKGATTEVIDVTTTENDTTPLFTGLYFDFKPNNVSWLIGGGQANNEGIYRTCYNELVNVLNGETKYGDLKVVDTADMIAGVDYSEYWKVNQTNMTFTTPTKISSRSYEGIAPVVGNGMTLGMTNGTNNAGFVGISGPGMGYGAGAYGVTVGTSTGNVGTSPSGSALGVTTDPTKSGIEAHLVENTRAQLYFKVANAVQNLELLNAGEVLEAVNGVIPNNKELITSYSMMSNRYEDLTLGATGSTYTAPDNGWFIINKIAGSDWYYCALTNNNTGEYDFRADYRTSPCTPRVYARRGDVIKAEYNATGALTYFRFYYAEGNK